MYNILLSLGGGIAAFLILKLVAGLPFWVAFPLATLVFAAAFYLASRIVMKKVMDIVESASKDIQAQRVDKGLRVLETALRYGKWQIYVDGQIHAQLGMILYMKRDFAAAFPHLEKAFFKNWVAMGMLAISHMKRSNRGKMTETFEKAVQGSPKEPLLWNVYAWCLDDGGDREKAIEILERGLKKVPGDERLVANLEALRQGKKMKMKNYGEMWLQFHLEKQSVVMKQQAAAMGVRRRIVRK